MKPVCLHNSRATDSSPCPICTAPTLHAACVQAGFPVVPHREWPDVMGSGPGDPLTATECRAREAGLNARVLALREEMARNARIQFDADLSAESARLNAAALQAEFRRHFEPCTPRSVRAAVWKGRLARLGSLDFGVWALWAGAALVAGWAVWLGLQLLGMGAP